MSDFDDVVRPYGNEELINTEWMQGAKSESILDA